MERCALAWETGELVEREEKKGERRVRTEEGERRKEERGGGREGGREEVEQGLGSAGRQAAGRVVRGKRGSKL